FPQTLLIPGEDPHAPPVTIGIEGGCLGRNREGILPQILFVDRSVLIDQKTHVAGDAVLRRICNQGKPADHDALDHIVVGSTWSSLALLHENPVEISMVGGSAVWRSRPYSLRSLRQPATGSGDSAARPPSPANRGHLWFRACSRIVGHSRVCHCHSYRAWRTRSRHPQW